MQYTAKKPFNSVLILHPDGLRYRFQEDHVYKDIRFAQVTKVKVKRDYFLFFMFYILGPVQALSVMYLIYFEDLSWIHIAELIFWIGYFFSFFLFPIRYHVEVNKGPLTAEVFATHSRKEAYAIKAAIESRC